VNSLISLATHDCYYDGHAADRPQLSAGRSGGLHSDVSGMRRRAVEWPIPCFFVPSVCRIPFAVRSSQRGGTLNRSPARLSATGQCQRNFRGCRPLECAALNKNHVSRIGPSHPRFACSYLFASISKCSSVPRGESCGKSSCWVLAVWFNGISTLFEAHAPPAQPTASQMPRERLAT
jgi:hypothetical protein